MSVLEPVVATLIANTKQFTAGLAQAEASMMNFTRQAEAAGTAGGANFAGGTTKGVRAGEQGVKRAAATVGEDLAAGVAVGGKKAEREAAIVGQSILSKLLAGFKGGTIGSMTKVFTSFGGKMPGIVAGAEGAATALEGAAASAGGFGAAVGGIPLAAAAAAAAVAGVAFVTGKLAVDFEHATDQIAAQERISVEQAREVGNAFLTTAGSMKFTATDLADSFAPVAGAMRSLTGAAISTEDSLTFMEASAHLAEGTNQSLKSSTSGLSKVMVAYGIDVGQASAVSDLLFKATSSTGMGFGALTSMLQRMKTMMGIAAPGIVDVTTLLVLLKDSGMSGRGAVAAVNTAFKNLVNPTEKAADALKKAGIVTQDTQGTLLPLRDIFRQLHHQIKGMGDGLAVATLKEDGFGASSAKLVEMVRKGGKAVQEYRLSLLESGSATDAAQKATGGLEDSWDKMYAAGKDVAIMTGQLLMPVMRFLWKVLKDVASILLDTLTRGFKATTQKLHEVQRAAAWLGNQFHKLWESAHRLLAPFAKLGHFIGGLIGANHEAGDATDKHDKKLNNITGSAEKARRAAEHYASVLHQQAQKAGLTDKTLEGLTTTMNKSSKSILKDLDKQSKAAKMTAEEMGNLAVVSGKAFGDIGKSMTEAQTGAQQAFASSYNLVSAFSSATSVAGQDIASFYTNSVADATTFTSNLTQAIQDGYDPKTIASIITAGPQQAGVLLKGMVADYSPELVQLMKYGADALEQQGQRAVEVARLTQHAVIAETQKAAAELPIALQINQQQAVQGATATIESVAAALGLPYSKVKRIAGEYGQTLPDAFAAARDGTISEADATAQALVARLGDPKYNSDILTHGNRIGLSFGTGVGAGIDSSQDDVNSAFQTLMDNAVEWVTANLIINSPSRVTRDKIGKPFTEGIAVGITDAQPLAIQAARATMMATIDQSKKTLSRAAQLRTGLSLGASLGDALGSRTQAIRLPNTQASQEPMVFHVTTPVNVDGHAIAQVVTKYQLRRARSTGNIHGQWAGGSQTATATAINVNAITR